MAGEWIPISAGIGAIASIISSLLHSAITHEFDPKKLVSAIVVGTGTSFMVGVSYELIKSQMGIT